MWKSRLGEALPAIEKDYPKARWLYLTLTVRNCPIVELRETIKLMNSAWQRLTQLKVFPALGFFKSLEVTKGDDGTAHPHFHVLMMVPNSYFQGTKYIKQDKWVQMWKKAMRLDYDPSVDIRAVKSKSSSTSNILEIIPEIAKYSVKEEDLISDANWMIEYTRQIYKMRAVSLGGVLKKYLTEEDATSEELILSLSDLHFDREAFTQLAASLRMGDFVKFAKYIPGPYENDSNMEVVRSSIVKINENEK